MCPMQTNPDPASATTDDTPIPLRARLIAPTAPVRRNDSLCTASACSSPARNANMARRPGVPFTASLAGVERAPFYEVIHSPEAETHYATTLAIGPASHRVCWTWIFPWCISCRTPAGGPGGTALEREPPKSKAPSSVASSILSAGISAPLCPPLSWRSAMIPRSRRARSIASCLRWTARCRSLSICSVTRSEGVLDSFSRQRRRRF